MKDSNNKISYGHHNIYSEDIDEVIKILTSDQITQGKTVDDFGKALADFSGAKYGVAVSNGTAALHLSVAACGISAGDEVITTPMTFCATSNAVLYQGGEVKFVDIDSKTLNIDVNLIEEKITPKTKAIIPVDFRGHPADLKSIYEIAKKYNLMVIEDGSHSIGSQYKHDDKIFKCGDGIHADLCTYSFHPVKHITTGEGGAIMTNNKTLYDKLMNLRKHGIDRRSEMFDTRSRKGEWVYDMETLGFNYRLTDFQAALGISQLKKINNFIKYRRKIVSLYNKKFANYEELITPYESSNVDSNFHIYTLQVKKNPMFDRYDLFKYLVSRNYLPMVHYIPVHLLSYYQKNFGYRKGDFPISENYYNRSISLPLYPNLPFTEVEKVISTITDYIKKKR